MSSIPIAYGCFMSEPAQQGVATEEHRRSALGLPLALAAERRYVRKKIEVETSMREAPFADATAGGKSAASLGNSAGTCLFIDDRFA